MVAVIPRIYMNPEKSYIVIGGLGGVGMELVNWMITRGARSIVLNSRSGVRTGYQALCIRRWKKRGINVILSKKDVASSNGSEELIKESEKLAPVGGIFNLAAVLSDAMLENLSEAHFKETTVSKIEVTNRLDAASRKLCPRLDYFVVFSSITCGRGNIAQTNYGLANSGMERIIEDRRYHGLPGLAIQWGAIGDVGICHNLKNEIAAQITGSSPQPLSSCLATMDAFLRQHHAILASMILPKNQQKKNLDNKLELLEAIGKIFGIDDVSIINPNTTFIQLGMDSLMDTEIKRTLEINYDLVLDAQEIRSLTFSKLVTVVTRRTASSAAYTARYGVNERNGER